MNDCTNISALLELSSKARIIFNLRLLIVPSRSDSSNSPSPSFAISPSTRSRTSSSDCPCFGFPMIRNSPASGLVYAMLPAPSTFCCWLRLRSRMPAEPLERIDDTTSAINASSVPAPGYFQPIMMFSASRPYTSFVTGDSITVTVSKSTSGSSLFGCIWPKYFSRILTISSGSKSPLRQIAMLFGT